MEKFTGLPFVFAAWLSTEKLPEHFIAEFNAVLQHGVDNIHQAVEDDFHVKNLSKPLTLSYLTQRIDYRLNEEKRKALALFLEYIARL